MPDMQKLMPQNRFSKKTEATPAPQSSPAPPSKDEKTTTATTTTENKPEQKLHLQHIWSMSYTLPNQRPKKGVSTWKNSAKHIMNVSTAQDFWRLYNNLVEPSKMPLKSDYHLFKQGIKPTYEDKANKAGGRWILEFGRSDTDKEKANKVWMYMLLSLIGEHYDDVDYVCGAVLSVRRLKLRISLWTKDSSKEQTQRRIGHQFRDFVNQIIPGQKTNLIGFQVHDTSNKRTNFTNPNLYSLPPL